MKIGIYGGTFDPIHRGHITAAQAAAQQLGLDLLLLIPASIPPHKALPEGGADAAQRLEMATLATAELSCPAQVLDVEVKRRGKSYTADTLRTLRQQYPEDELWLLMGTDMFLSLQDWREPQEILRLARVAAFSRTGDPEQQRFARQRTYLEETFGAQVTVVAPTELTVNVSATVTLASGYEIGQVQQPIEDAIEAYLLTVRQAWDTNTSATSVVYEANVYLARITAAIVGVTGVVNATNVQLNGGTADLILTESGATQQVPVMGTVSLSAGT